MEEFLLRRFLADQELNIINQKHVDIPVLVAEFGHSGIAAVPDGIDQLICKIL